MISYAQNFEDVILWRVFKDIISGFYIDVGAYHPRIDSVTKWFYDQGWNGINIEPSKEYLDRFYDERPRDLNLNLASPGVPQGYVPYRGSTDSGKQL